MGWKTFGVLELTALPSTLQEHWLPSLEAADALLVGGGNGLYLSYWMQQSGLGEPLPMLLQEKVYVGVSAGSVLVTQSVNVNREELEQTGVYHDDEYDETAPPNAGSDKTLGLVALTLHPHLGADSFPAASWQIWNNGPVLATSIIRSKLSQFLPTSVKWYQMSKCDIAALMY